MSSHRLHSVPAHAVARSVTAHRRAALADWADLAERLQDPGLCDQVDAAGVALVAALRSGGTLLVAGNGGSAAIASHIAAEFIGKCVHDRDPLPAVNLAESLAAITAIGNDYGYEQVFARAVGAHGRPGDVLLVMSTSGRSPNIISALATAAQREITTIAMTGAAGLPEGVRADHLLAVPSASTPRVQEVHMTWAHAWCEAVDVLSQPDDQVADRAQ